MLRVFIDESGEKQELFVMAGYVVPAENCTNLSNEWRRLLDLDSPPYQPLARFKMKDLNRTKAGLQRAELFYRAIEQYAACAFSVAIDVQGLRQSIGKFPWPSWVTDIHRIENPYYFAFKAAVQSVAMLMNESGLTGPVEFNFDDHTSKGKCLEGWGLLKASMSVDLSRHFCEAPIFNKEEDELLLQTADLYAFWVREWIADGTHDGVKNLNFPWETKVQMLRMAVLFVEADFTREWERAAAVDVVRRAGVHNAAQLLSGRPTILRK